MKKELRDNLLRKLADNSQEGEALREYIKVQIKRLDTVSGAETIEEVKGRQYALDILKKLFRVLNPKKDTNTKRGVGTEYL